MNRHIFNRANAWQLLMIAILFISATMTLTSCGDDEPKSTVDYYLNVEEEFLINGLTDHTDRYFNPITRMREAISKAYPNPDEKGNDQAVIAACDKEYETYVEMYNGGEEHFTCLFHLVKAIKKDGIVAGNEVLKTYTYDINPFSEPEEPQD